MCMFSMDPIFPRNQHTSIISGYWLVIDITIHRDIPMGSWAYGASPGYTLVGRPSSCTTAQQHSIGIAPVSRAVEMLKGLSGKLVETRMFDAS